MKFNEVITMGNKIETIYGDNEVWFRNNDLSTLYFIDKSGRENHWSIEWIADPIYLDARTEDDIIRGNLNAIENMAEDETPKNLEKVNKVMIQVLNFKLNLQKIFN